MTVDSRTSHERLAAVHRVVCNREQTLGEAKALACVLHDSMRQHGTPALAGDQIGTWLSIVALLVDRLEPAVDAIYSA